MATCSVLNLNLNLLVLLECYICHLVSKHVRIVGTCSLNHTVRKVVLCNLYPRRSCQRSCLCIHQVPYILFSGSLTNSVVCSWSLKTCKNFVAYDCSTTCIAHDLWSRTCCLCINIVNHWNDVVHVNSVNTCEFHLSTQIVAAVAQYCTPNNGNLCTLVLILIVGNKLNTVVVLCTANGCCIACKCLCLHVNECHCRGRNIVTATKCHCERLSTGKQIHGITTCKVKRIAHLHEAGCKHLVAEYINTIVL